MQKIRQQGPPVKRAHFTLIPTQLYFWTTQKCKRYLKVSFKYLVIFRRRNASLVPFGAILTLPPPPWEFATTIISAEEGWCWPHQASIATPRVWMKQQAKDPAQAKILPSPYHDVGLQHLTPNDNYRTATKSSWGAERWALIREFCQGCTSSICGREQSTKTRC